MNCGRGALPPLHGTQLPRSQAAAEKKTERERERERKSTKMHGDVEAALDVVKVAHVELLIWCDLVWWDFDSIGLLMIGDDEVRRNDGRAQCKMGECERQSRHVFVSAARASRSSVDAAWAA
jgi:hypothetical protein